MNVAEYLIKKLEELGINDYFGVSDLYNKSIINAIYSNAQTNWIGCTNELNAGYAADGYARIRKYGAVVTTYGVGELSVMNAIAGSNAENVPVVHIVGMPETSCISNKKLLHYNFQNVNYNAFEDAYKNITASTTRLSRENAKMEIDRVLKVLVKEKRPVYIALPEDVAILDISDRYVSYDWNSNRDVLNNVVQKIAKKINTAQRPVVIGDVLVKRFDAELEYREFISKSKIPHTTLLMGKNLYSMNSETFLGGYFSDLRNPIAKKYIDDSDCLIAIGVINSDLNTFGNNFPNINNHVAIYGDFVYIDGHKFENVKMQDVLNSLLELIEPKNIEIDRPNIGYKHKDSQSEPLSSDYIYMRLQEFIKENDIIISDTGTVPYGIAQVLLPENVNIEMQALWASTGWGTPAAFGASVAKPQSRVVLITGEGAHIISAMEIGNIMKQGLKPIIIVINNSGYASECLSAENVDLHFNEIPVLNYSKFARAFEGDVWSTKVSTSDDFDKALKVTLIMNKMCYIEVITDKSDVPAIAKDYTKKIMLNKAVQNTPNVYSASEMNNIVNINDLYNRDTNNSEIIFETIVHKSITEE